MKHSIEEIKKAFAKIALPKRPCAPETQKAKDAATQEELLQVIKSNFGWLIENKAISNEFLAMFDTDVAIKYGVLNTGFANSGYRNSGDSNSGYRNSGDSNSGNRNSGDSNSGNWNSGYRNSGDSNSGNWNSGYRNSGDSNSGYRNSGAFCTDPNPKAILFNKESSMTVKEWEEHPACQMMYSINPTLWVPASIMSPEEKEAHPKWETTEGYLKTIPLKEAWANFWHNLADEKKVCFTTLENFDASIFQEITGIKVTE